MTIRPTKISDFKQINQLNEEFFHEIRDFKALLKNKDDFLIVIEDNKKIVAFSGAHLNKWNKTARVIDIFVHPDSRRHGLGSKLIKELILISKKWKVRSLIAEAPSLNPVLSLYLKNGFRVCGYNDRYYSNDAKEIALFLSFDF